MFKDLLEVLQNQLNLISNQMYLGFSVTQFLILCVETMARKEMETVLNFLYSSQIVNGYYFSYRRSPF